MDRVAQQMQGGLQPAGDPGRTAPHRGQVPDGALEAAAGPAVLLAPVGVEADRHLSRALEVAQERRAPAAQERSVRDIQVLGQRLVAPAPGVDQGRAAPQPGGSVEVEPLAGPPASELFDGHVPVDGQRLQAGEHGERRIDVTPARLHEGQARVGQQNRHRAPEEVAGRHEVGVEQRHEFALGKLQTVGQGPGLVTGPGAPSNVPDVHARCTPASDGHGHERDRLVGRVVEHLDLQLAGRIVERDGSGHQPFGHIQLVEDGQLHGHRRPVHWRHRARRLG